MTLDRAALIARYLETRRETERLAAPLTPEDQMVQAMPDASPTKWHRAHTTWFFETFVLIPRGVPPVDPHYAFLFNSYYEAVGPRHERPKRGLLSRPTAEEVSAYRRAVDGRVVEVLESVDEAELAELAPLMALGVAHEEQHQELILTDILAAFAANALEPVYAPAAEAAGATAAAPASAAAAEMRHFDGGLIELGAAPADGFAFDNETPRHRVFVEPFALASRPICVAEVVAFAEAGGYGTPTLWLSEGWDWVRRGAIEAPGYARLGAGGLEAFTLHGGRSLDPDAPAGHLSYYEADAVARFLGGRLPTEAEWELAAREQPVAGHFRDDGVLVPRASAPAPPFALFGDVWEWTRSAYGPYPGYAPAAGALGEYNGKFMVGQMVLRGGSCLSNRAHLRATYRNFWPPATRFQMTGARLARDLR